MILITTVAKPRPPMFIGVYLGHLLFRWGKYELDLLYLGTKRRLQRMRASPLLTYNKKPGLLW
jgi:hypothetical protein